MSASSAAIPSSIAFSTGLLAKRAVQADLWLAQKYRDVQTRPARSLVSIEDVGIATAFLAHDAARLITGETLYIDGGYHIMD